jgi:hypothetical protein
MKPPMVCGSCHKGFVGESEDCCFSDEKLCPKCWMRCLVCEDLICKCHATVDEWEHGHCKECPCAPITQGGEEKCRCPREAKEEKKDTPKPPKKMSPCPHCTKPTRDFVFCLGAGCGVKITKCCYTYDSYVTATCTTCTMKQFKKALAADDELVEAAVSKKKVSFVGPAPAKAAPKWKKKKVPRAMCVADGCVAPSAPLSDYCYRHQFLSPSKASPCNGCERDLGCDVSFACLCLKEHCDRCYKICNGCACSLFKCDQCTPPLSWSSGLCETCRIPTPAAASSSSSSRTNGTPSLPSAYSSSSPKEEEEELDCESLDPVELLYRLVDASNTKLTRDDIDITDGSLSMPSEYDKKSTTTAKRIIDKMKREIAHTLLK